jgi:hypothetical protein
MSVANSLIQTSISKQADQIATLTTQLNTLSTQVDKLFPFFQNAGIPSSLPVGGGTIPVGTLTDLWNGIPSPGYGSYLFNLRVTAITDQDTSVELETVNTKGDIDIIRNTVSQRIDFTYTGLFNADASTTPILRIKALANTAGGGGGPPATFYQLVDCGLTFLRVLDA